MTITFGLEEDFSKRRMPSRRVRRHFSQLSEFERVLIIGMKTAGWSKRRVARQVYSSECVVRTCWEQWARDGTDVRRIGRLAAANLQSKRPVRVLPLTPKRRRLRLQWCHAGATWNETNFQNVVFGNESRFVLGTDDNHVQFHPRCRATHCPQSRRNGLEAITYAGRSTLIVVRVNLKGQRYVYDILRPHVKPFLNGLPGAIFQQDNARPHTARVAPDFLRHVHTLPWQALSPDLYPIEHVWDQLKRQMPLRYSVHDLEVAVQDLWVHLPQDYIRHLINTMPNRFAAYIAAEGGPKSY
ncbi:Transposable element Tcb2 transposase [Araneus ventricosus]|uniref:Transposable element Tcb2 transposase n=1 Tax=Araneus ventricosus TaxID=182803 RepID=A0A4Y2M199_ARAVE|nr:Transposable element Tcb2 transposase [Araneus ventricosus]